MRIDSASLNNLLNLVKRFVPSSLSKLAADVSKVATSTLRTLLCCNKGTASSTHMKHGVIKGSEHKYLTGDRELFSKFFNKNNIIQSED
jgi:hypothetical protein